MQESKQRPGIFKIKLGLVVAQVADDMTLAVLDTCQKVTALAQKVENELSMYLVTTDQRPNVAMELLMILNYINSLIKADLRRDTDFKSDGWIAEKVRSWKNAAEISIDWYLSGPADWHPPEGYDARKFAREEMMACVAALLSNANLIFNHIATTGAVRNSDCMMGDLEN